MFNLDSIKFLVSGGKYYFHSPMWSYVKTMSCDGRHLRFSINTKNTHFVKDNPRHIPAMFAFKLFIGFRLE